MTHIEHTVGGYVGGSSQSPLGSHQSLAPDRSIHIAGNEPLADETCRGDVTTLQSCCVSWALGRGREL